MLLVLPVGATQLPWALHSCEGGQPPQVPVQPSLPHVLPPQSGVQLWGEPDPAAPAADPPLPDAPPPPDAAPLPDAPPEAPPLTPPVETPPLPAAALPPEAPEPDVPAWPALVPALPPFAELEDEHAPAPRAISAASAVMKRVCARRSFIEGWSWLGGVLLLSILFFCFVTMRSALGATHASAE
jgi:hypothetical protein